MHWINLYPADNAIDFPNTVKPLLSEHAIKRTLSRVPKLTSYISLYNEPLFSGHLLSGRGH